MPSALFKALQTMLHDMPNFFDHELVVEFIRMLGDVRLAHDAFSSDFPVGAVSYAAAV
jgi:hypothetical protein